MDTTATSRRVLLVDDDEDEFVLVQDLLDRSLFGPWILEWSQTSAEALANVAHDPPDVVLLDYRLGPEDGLDCLRRLQEVDPTVPVVFFTGQAEGNIDTTALAGGASDFLHKWDVDGTILERSLRYAIERVRARQRLLEKERRFQSIFDNAATGIALLTLNGVVVESNAAFQRMLGYAAEDLEGTHFRALSETTDGSTSLDWSAKLSASEGRDYGLEAEMQRGDGGRIWTRSTFVVVPDDGERPPQLLALVQDITDIRRRKALERALEGLLPICSFCKRIRDDGGVWQALEEYIGSRSEAEFTHSVCASCAEEHYGVVDGSTRD